MLHRKSSVFALLCLVAMCIAVAIILPACTGSGGSVAQNSGDNDTIDPSTLPPGTGGLTFGIVWQPPSGSKQYLAGVFFNSCVDYGIDTITATVLSGVTPVTTLSWPCSLHKGTLPGVPAGSNYTLRIEGKSGGTMIWDGQATSLNVTAGVVTPAGTITMTYRGSDGTQPAAIISLNSSPSGTTSIPVTDRVKVVFSEAMQNSTINTTNIKVDNGLVTGTVSYDIETRTASFIPSLRLAYNTQYLVQVSGVKDAAGNTLNTTSLTFTTESAPAAAPIAPAALTTATGNGQAKLDWTAVDGAESYNVYYSTSNPVSTATGTQLGNVKAPSLHLDLTNGTTYYYIVTANNVFGESPASNQVSATPTAPASNPAAPGSLTVDYNGGASPYTVSWTPVAGMSYNLYWSTRAMYPDHNAADNYIRYVPGSQYVHSVAPNASYCYILTAVNSAGESADSKQVCGPGAGSIQFIWD